jgi:tyrosinase
MLRIPFWDWAAYPYLPDAVSHSSVTINTPDGQMEIDNPLYTYTFQDIPENQGIPLDMPMCNMSQTVRYWNTELQQSNQTAANASLIAQGPSILSLTYQIFTSVTDYTSFSCVSPGEASNLGNSIENIHNNVHDAVGGWGHMRWPEVSAFDPIFFLHHANMDRLFAMWQVLNPGSYIVPTLNTYGSYYELASAFVESESSSASAPLSQQ